MEEIISYLLSPETIPQPFNDIIEISQIVFIVLSIVFLGVIIFVLLVSQRLNLRFFEEASEFLSFKPQGSSKLLKEWKKIEKKLDSGLESEYKLAIIEADMMLDKTLERIGHSEKTIEEKLEKTTSSELENIDEIKEARKTRNNVVYDPDYQLTLEKARETLKVYERTFRNLSAIS